MNPEASNFSATTNETPTAPVWDRDYILKFIKDQAQLVGEFDNVLQHCLKVEQVALAIGKLVHLSSSQLELLGKSALLHDAGKKFEVLGRKSDLFKDRFEAEEMAQFWLHFKGVPDEILAVMRGTDMPAAQEYLEGGLSGPQNWLARILFFADEIVDDTEVVPWRVRIKAWSDPELFRPRAEYQGQSLKKVESKLAAFVGYQIRDKAGIPRGVDLIALLKAEISTI